MGDIGRVEVADGNVGDGGVEEELMFRDGDIALFLRRKDDPMGAFFQRSFELDSIWSVSALSSISTND